MQVMPKRGHFTAALRRRRERSSLPRRSRRRIAGHPLRSATQRTPKMGAVRSMSARSGPPRHGHLASRTWRNRHREASYAGARTVPRARGKVLPPGGRRRILPYGRRAGRSHAKEALSQLTAAGHHVVQRFVYFVIAHYETVVCLLGGQEGGLT